MTDDRTRHDLSPRKVTHSDPNHAAVTGVTGVLPFPEMTGDRLPQVPPPRVRRERETSGTANPSPPTARRPSWLHDGPLTDRVRLTSCQRCRRPVLEALADETMPTRIDLIRLTPLAELEHLVHGGTTYRLWPDRPGATLRLAHRNPEHIRAHPGRGMPLHDCATNHGPPDPTILATHRPATTPTECPF